MGWTLDRANYTIQLPEWKVQKIQALLNQSARKNSMRLHEFQKVVYKLVHTSFGILKGTVFIRKGTTLIAMDRKI